MKLTERILALTAGMFLGCSLAGGVPPDSLQLRLSHDDSFVVNLPAGWTVASQKDYRDSFFKYKGEHVQVSYIEAWTKEIASRICIYRITWNDGVYPITQQDVLPLTMPFLNLARQITTQPRPVDSEARSWRLDSIDTVTGKRFHVEIERSLFGISMITRSD